MSNASQTQHSGGSGVSLNVTLPQQRTKKPSGHSYSSSTAPEDLNKSIQQKQLEQRAAATTIERCWLAYRDRQMFQLLKNSLCAAEHSMSLMILRRVCPTEAAFFNDKSVDLKIRFRFGGSEFPPMVFFKIFSRGAGVKYVSGKKTIRPATEAAQDACERMGHRKFYDQMIQDAIQREQYKITDEVDITTLKDFMQYHSNLDETPPELGGRANRWRKLNLTDVPRHTIFYDVIDFIYSRKMTPKLQDTFHVLSSRPVTQEMYRQQMELLSHVSTPPPVPRGSPQKSKPLSSRRSKEMRKRVAQMRRMYGLNGKDSVEIPSVTEEVPGQEFEGVDAECDQEADELYQWTQQLSFDDAIATPKLAS